MASTRSRTTTRRTDVDHDECRHVIKIQIERWVRRNSGPLASSIVLHRLDRDGRPAETIYTCCLKDPVDHEVAVREDAAQLVLEGRLYGIVERAQRDANERKGGVQIYALYPIYYDGTRGPRKKFRAAPEEAEPEPASEAAP
jgi:hypothetical protein